MNTLRKGAVSVLCALTALTFAAVAQQPSPSGARRGNEAAMSATPDTPAISASRMAASQELSPGTFVSKATQAGMTEVEMGKLALRKSSNPEVRKFAQRMVDDHGKAGAELAAIAKSSKLKVPAKLDSAHAEMVQAMNDKSDADFDTAYVKDMLSDHKEALQLFHEATALPDVSLAQFATRTLPTLEEHQRMADALRANTHVATSE